MRAVLSKSVGGPETLVIEDLPSPKAGPGQVVLSVKACGVAGLSAVAANSAWP